jgi:L-ascorbate metabolism protein UlaG (beta-lactamase superfamily)
VLHGGSGTRLQICKRITLYWSLKLFFASPMFIAVPNTRGEKDMKIHQIRNATALIELGEHRVLVDPMLARVGVLPGFKVFGGGRRANPLVELPEGAMGWMERATAVLVTHEHPDHLDLGAIAWIKKRGVEVWTSRVDAASLRGKGLKVREVEDGVGGMRAEVVPGLHGRGVKGWWMGPVSGFYLSCEGEPSVYITGDTVMTGSLREALGRLAPDVVVAPAGAANFGFGEDILFSLEELDELMTLTRGDVVFNHLESLDHCPTTRVGLRARMQGYGGRVHVPEDGELLEFTRSSGHKPALRADVRRVGIQKRVTARLSGT